MILVYDITSESSCDNITKYLGEIEEVSMCDCMKVRCGLCYGGWVRASYVAMVMPIFGQV